MAKVEIGTGFDTLQEKICEKKCSEEDIDKIVCEYKKQMASSSAPNLIKRKIKQIFRKKKPAKSTSAIDNATKTEEVEFKKCVSYKRKQTGYVTVQTLKNQCQCAECRNATPKNVCTAMGENVMPTE